MYQSGGLIDRSVKRIGFRTIELVQEPLNEADQHGMGSTFLFEVNGVRIFIGGTFLITISDTRTHETIMTGSNWIPADNFLTTVDEGRFRAWLNLLRDGNQNMVRLWGGGVYEPDIFYDICDGWGAFIICCPIILNPAQSLAFWSGKTSNFPVAFIQPMMVLSTTSDAKP